MKIIVFGTEASRTEGLQHRSFIPDDTVFVFPNLQMPTFFHSQNVPEPFDIAFLDRAGTVLDLKTVVPPHAIAPAPRGTALALEAKGGRLEMWGLQRGQPVPFDPLQYPV